ncbi:hypothetical protein F5878DRAFT_135055 [Lentinula raphanica]|uniref:FHA domain-containing protein n=1 Tax=Lentinula raphanica TaxID=153919 RepID=A0AA38UI61_9AGAR|nr:hypothetical protein F5878DRAFT_135055 [Lentinula raphanica]
MSSPSSPMIDNSQIGRYGTLSLMKQNEPNTVITSFGIDSDNLTFGRDQKCGVRLYYPDVSPIHCKITFKERKAYLVVLGTQGLVVDGCKVFPGSSTSTPNTIPLGNQSEIEIHGKRFKFTYPPKELRAQLSSTPTLPKRRALRLSMIESAEVFSPRPSANAMENLRVLQSPLKPYTIRSRSSSPHIPTPSRSLFPSTTISQRSSEDADDEEEIILVEGNSPRVVEEAEDLIILEDVEITTSAEVAPTPSDIRRSPSKSPTKPQYVPAPPPMLLPPQPPMTPRRSRPTLHKAVLIRSAQRVVLAEMRREEELEEQEEEAEVTGSILVEDEDEDEGLESVKDHEGTREETEEQNDSNSSTWKESLGRIWPFRRSTSPTKDISKEEGKEHPVSVEPMDVDSEGDEANNNKDGNVTVSDVSRATPAQAPALYPRLDGSLLPPPSRQLFNTPQPHRPAPPKPRSSLRPSSSALPSQPRISLGGNGEPRRIKVEEQPWKVQDLVVPSPPSSPTRPSNNQPSQPGMRDRTPGLNTLSDAERRAIQERRRSALRTPDNFFLGGIPGMSPTKNAGQTPARTARKSLAASSSDDQLDTRSLLEKMKETVEGIKAERRASLASPQKRPFSETNPAAEEFSLLRSPAKSGVRLSPAIIEDEETELSPPHIIATSESPKTADDSNVSRLSASGSYPAEGDVQMTDVAREKDISLPAFANPSKLARPISKRVGRDRFVDTPSLADDEASPDVIGRMEDRDSDDEGQSSRKSGMVLRGIGKSLSLTTSELSKDSLNPSSTVTASSLKDTVEDVGTAPNVEAPTQDVPDDDDAQPQAPESLKPQPTTSRTRSRSRSKTPGTGTLFNPSSTNEKHDTTTTPLPLRRSTRKASAEPDAHTTDDEGTATKRARSTARSRTRGQTAVESEPESSSKAASKKPPSRTTRARAKTPVSEAETDDTNNDEPTVTKPKRGRRPKVAAVPEVIKEEETDELPATRSTTRTRKTATSSNSSLIPAPAGRSKKTAPPEVLEETDVNKENSHASDDEPVVTKTKTGRPRKATAPKIKEEVTTEPETLLHSGAKTRTMRTRSKT